MELIVKEHGIELVHENGNWILKKEYGFSPVQTLVASVAACGGYVFEGILTRSSIPHRLDTVQVSYEVNETKTVKSVSKISIEYYLEAEDDYKDRIERIVKLVHKGCPVMQSLNSDIVVTETIIYV